MADPSAMNTDSMLLLQTNNNLNFTDDQLHSFDHTKDLASQFQQLKEQDSVDNLIIDRDEEVKSDNRFRGDLIDIQFNNFTTQKASEYIQEEQSSHFDAINGNETG